MSADSSCRCQQRVSLSEWLTVVMSGASVDSSCRCQQQVNLALTRGDAQHSAGQTPCCCIAALSSSVLWHVAAAEQVFGRVQLRQRWQQALAERSVGGPLRQEPAALTRLIRCRRPGCGRTVRARSSPARLRSAPGRLRSARRGDRAMADHGPGPT